jgi:hypothetical protein
VAKLNGELVDQVQRMQRIAAAAKAYCECRHDAAFCDELDELSEATWDFWGDAVAVDVVEMTPAAPGKCRDCGCTESNACEGGCGWYEEPGADGLGWCTSCAANPVF